jgi:hypothetical protein
MKFSKWMKEYNRINEIELKKWQKQNNSPGIFPVGFDSEIIQHYIAYKNEEQTKHLVWATLFLAVVSIILSILTFILK